MDFGEDAQSHVGMRQPKYTAPMILCCGCGVSIESNAANMCAQCLQSNVDITSGIPKQVTIFWCRNCRRYQRPPWEAVELESQKMLSLCLSKVKGLNKDVKLVDAAFIWTEHHSRRIKVKLVVQKDVLAGVVMQQVFVVEFVVGNMQCPDCERSFTEHTWKVCVQVRQNRKHKRTLYYLEQLLIRHNVCAGSLDIKEVPQGLDFYWDRVAQSNRLITFLRSVLPVRVYKAGEKLISQDDSSNTKKYKFGMHVEIADAAKEDLVLANRQLVTSMGGVSPVLLVTRVSNTLHLIDPVSLKTFEIDAHTYFHPHTRPKVLLAAQQLVDYIVLDVELIGDNQHNYYRAGAHAAAQAEVARAHNVHNAAHNNNRLNAGLSGFNKQTAANARICLAEVTVARASDFGRNDTQFIVKTHLGGILRVGDTVLGYDLQRTNVTGDVSNALRGRELPEAVLVRKTYPQRKKRAERRHWKLRLLAKEQEKATAKKGKAAAAAQAKDEAEWEGFLQEIEEDPDMRAKINLYKRYDTEEEAAQARAALMRQRQGVATAVAAEDEDDEDGFPEVRMDELMDSLQRLNMDDDDAGAGAGAGDAIAEEEDEEINYGDEDGSGAQGPQVVTGRGIRNQNWGLPAKQGGFDDGEDDALNGEGGL